MKIERLSAKVEDYLETILRLSETPRGATGDIAAALNVQPSTVSAALKSLTEQGLLNYEPYGVAVDAKEGTSQKKLQGDMWACCGFSRTPWASRRKSPK